VDTLPERNVNFVYQLDGDVAEIDVFKLAPTLLALGQLIQDSNKETRGDAQDIGVNVRPFREGSFIVELTLFPHSNFQQLLDWLNSESVARIKTLLEWIGLISGNAIGAVHLIKWARGKPKRIEEIGPGEFRYVAGDDRSITIKAPVHQILSNVNITNNIYKVYGSPLEQEPKITDVRTYLSGDEKSATMVTREEVPSFSEYVAPPPDRQEPSEVVSENISRDVYLNPKRGSFDGDPRDWSFFRGDQIITATIKDQEFLDRCIAGEYRLNGSDLLRVDLLERQRIIGTQVLKPSYEILRVTEYIRGQNPPELNLVVTA